MVTFSKNTQTGEWDLLGPAEALKTGEVVEVHKLNGTTKAVRVAIVSRPFTGTYGETAGVEMAFASIASNQDQE